MFNAHRRNASEGAPHDPKGRYLGSYDAPRLASATTEKIRAWVQTDKLTNHGHKMKLLIDREQLLDLVAAKLP